MRRHPSEPDKEKIVLGAVLLALGALCTFVGVEAYRSSSFLPFQINPSESEGPPVGTILLCIVGLFLGWLAGRQWRDSRPIPSEVVPPPIEPVIGQDFAWRKVTSLRFLDRKIESFEELEEQLVEASISSA